MMRGFSFTACVLLCLALSAYSLKCRYCMRDIPDFGCEHKVNVCFPRPNEQCISITFYEGKEVRYRLQGCTNSHRDCMHSKRGQKGTSIKTVCCKRDMCNHSMSYLH
ncbi:Hypothetical predicted protein [Podarcis lilfordi]|uniref:UPAR/Ly6 domain-containing protein n=1 Tax=Podarcis lilfordi TaxID=74358 RepID=A0AA35NXX5_9SAUR|nr:Hypothetical predicted protein [Podarcis lilfordi]